MVNSRNVELLFIFQEFSISWDCLFQNTSHKNEIWSTYNPKILLKPSILCSFVNMTMQYDKFSLEIFKKFRQTLNSFLRRKIPRREIRLGYVRFSPRKGERQIPSHRPTWLWESHPGPWVQCPGDPPPYSGSGRAPSSHPPSLIWNIQRVCGCVCRVSEPELPGAGVFGWSRSRHFGPAPAPPWRFV